jgi:hypothetical protein
MIRVQTIVKGNLLFLVLLFLLLFAGLTARADMPAFGNTTNGAGTAIIVGSLDGYNPEQGVVAFTPLTNFALTSVTVWLTGYNGQNGQNFSMSLYTNNYFYNAVVYFNVPLPNDGTTAAFTFTNPSGATVLQTNQEYWLFITGYGTSADTSANWLDGTTPGGDAVYYGAEAGTNAEYVSISAIPAFTINSTNASEAGAPSSYSISLHPGITISGTIGAAYEVQYTTNLASGNWVNLTNIVLPSSPFLYFDPTPVSGQNRRFYKVVP